MDIALGTPGNWAPWPSGGPSLFALFSLFRFYSLRMAKARGGALVPVSAARVFTGSDHRGDAPLLVRTASAVEELPDVS